MPTTIKQDIFARLLMGFKVPILEGDELLRNWLEQHKKANEETFSRCKYSVDETMQVTVLGIRD